MLSDKDISARFAKALQDKDLDMISSVLSKGCVWHTGKHFGFFIDKMACLGHFKKIFNSFHQLHFAVREASTSSGVSVLEYLFAEREVAKSKIRPTDYTGVFIINIFDEKIVQIRTYYEDRTQNPRQKELSSPTQSSTSRAPIRLEEHTKRNPNIPSYDPITGLPL